MPEILRPTFPLDQIGLFKRIDMDTVKASIDARLEDDLKVVRIDLETNITEDQKDQALSDLPYISERSFWQDARAETVRQVCAYLAIQSLPEPYKATAMVDIAQMRLPSLVLHGVEGQMNIAALPDEYKSIANAYLERGFFPSVAFFNAKAKQVIDGELPTDLREMAMRKIDEGKLPLKALRFVRYHQEVMKRGGEGYSYSDHPLLALWRLLLEERVRCIKDPSHQAFAKALLEARRSVSEALSSIDIFFRTRYHIEEPSPSNLE